MKKEELLKAYGRVKLGILEAAIQASRKKKGKKVK